MPEKLKAEQVELRSRRHTHTHTPIKKARRVPRRHTSALAPYPQMQLFESSEIPLHPAYQGGQALSPVYENGRPTKRNTKSDPTSQHLRRPKSGTSPLLFAVPQPSEKIADAKAPAGRPRYNQGRQG